nr:hypothetical protein [Tanacetum cinerariifolium]
MKCQLLYKRLNELMMMVLVIQTEDCDMLLHMVTTDMKLLVVEIETDDITVDDVDKVSCSTDVEKSKQVDLKCAHLSIELHLHDIHVDQDKHVVDRRITMEVCCAFWKAQEAKSMYIGPFKILARVGLVVYTLELLEELKGIHSTFHVSNLKKCLAEGDVFISMDEIQLDDKLHVIKEPVEVMDKKEREDQIKKKYPHLFTSKDEAWKSG